MLVLELGGCGSGGDESQGPAAVTDAGATGPTTCPLTITNCSSTETFTKTPETVLTEGAPSNTALLIQSRLKNRIVKTTADSTRSDIPGMPDELASLPRVKVPDNDVPREETIALHPDLVLAGFDYYFQPENSFPTRDELHAAGIQAYAPSYFCAQFTKNPSPEVVTARKNAGIEQYLQTILELGRIFDVNDRAAALVADIRKTMEEPKAKVANLPPKKVTITDPSIADETMSGGAVYVYGSKILDELLSVTGGTNVWSDQDDFQSVSKKVATLCDRPTWWSSANTIGEYDWTHPPKPVASYIKAKGVDMDVKTCSAVKVEEVTLVRARAEEVATVLAAIYTDLCVATPCGILAPLLEALEQVHPDFTYVHREDNAIGLAAGTAMSGKRSLVLMQNSGFGQSVNVLASLVVPFCLPIGLVISMRGTEIDTTWENLGMGRVTVPVLDHLSMPWQRLTVDSFDDALRWFDVTGRSGPVALLVPPDLFGWSPTR